MKTKILSLLVATAMLLSVGTFLPVYADEDLPTPQIIFIEEGTMEKDGENIHTPFTIPSTSGYVFLTFTRPALTGSFLNLVDFEITMRNTQTGEVVISTIAKGDSPVSVSTARTNFVKGGEYVVTVKNTRNPSTNNPGLYPFDYTVSVTYTDNAGQLEVEPNETPETATQVELNKPITGYVENGGLDFYRFELEQPGKIGLTFRHANLERTTDIWRVSLIDTDGVVLFSFTSKGNASSFSGNDSINDYLDAGVYYVRVNKGNTSTSRSEVDYTLTVNYELNEGQFEIEPNNTKELATAIEIDTEVVGNLSSTNDVDWYKFTITEQSLISVTFANPNLETNSARWSISLFDSVDFSLGTFDARSDTPVRTVPETAFNLPEGTYYIRIQIGGSSGLLANPLVHENYKLTVNTEKIEYCSVCKRPIENCICVDVLGDIDGNGVVAIADALEILKYLAGMNSQVEPNTKAWAASLITPASRAADKPAIGDVLEILKKLAGMTSLC
ncbi:MAG: hypothetical protein FWG83_05715 [Oscillospiraceae bacterium]|nr:hypothetical protein [Oscillospiraceae bacterium]